MKKSINILLIFITSIFFLRIEIINAEQTILLKILENKVCLSDFKMQKRDYDNLSNDEFEKLLRKVDNKVWEVISKDLVITKGLQAADDEIEKYFNSIAMSVLHKIEERRKKIEEINMILNGKNLDFSERVKYKKQLKEIKRASRNDKKKFEYYSDIKNMTQNDKPIFSYWIEIYKINKYLFEKYEGEVVASTFGPMAVGGKKSLLNEYKTKGMISIFDKKLSNAYWRMVSKPIVGNIIEPEKIIFSPPWEIGFGQRDKQ